MKDETDQNPDNSFDILKTIFTAKLILFPGDWMILLGLLAIPGSFAIKKLSPPEYWQMIIDSVPWTETKYLREYNEKSKIE